MKPVQILILALGAVLTMTAVGQQALSPEEQVIMIEANRAAAVPTAREPTFTKFDLDFPGGTPAELVAAIEKATGKPLNAIIPTEHEDVQLPPLKMGNVAVPTLFEALISATRKTVPFETSYYGGGGPPGYRTVQQFVQSYGFQSQDNPWNKGDETVWYFYYEKYVPPQQPNECRYYQLDPYMGSYSIDDITTAIQTGWRMLGEKKVPELSFHEETKLLIAVGNASELSLIDDVLKQLRPPTPDVDPTPAAAAKPEKSQ